MTGRIAVVAAACVLAVASAAVAGPPGERVCRFADDRISESSGLATSTDGSALWTHNDSGDTARFFSVDPESCATRATYRLDLPEVPVPGVGTATSFDWEDMARGTAADGSPVLLFGDIGDNYEIRAGGTTVYEVLEPAPSAADPAAETPVPVRAVYQLVYPSGPHDAETLLALPDGRLVVVTKDRDMTGAYTGHSEVYATTARPSPGPNALEKVADLDVTALPGVDATDSGQLALTAGDVTRDGSRLVVRSYTTAYEYSVRGGDLTAAFRTAPTVLPLLASKQGEGIAYDVSGRTVWTSSEGVGTSTDASSGVVDTYRLKHPHDAHR